MPDRVEIDTRGYAQVFEDRNGPVGRDLEARATRVQLAAKAQVGVKTGLLKRDITKQWAVSKPGMLTIRIGSDVKHARVHHDGARPHIIRAKNAKAMRWVNESGQVVFASVVHHPGHRANRYLTDSLRFAK